MGCPAHSKGQLKHVMVGVALLLLACSRHALAQAADADQHTTHQHHQDDGQHDHGLAMHRHSHEQLGSGHTDKHHDHTDWNAQHHMTAAHVEQLASLLRQAQASHAGHHHGHDHSHSLKHDHSSSHDHAHQHGHGHKDQVLTLAEVLNSVGPSNQPWTDSQTVAAISQLLTCATDPHCTLAEIELLAPQPEAGTTGGTQVGGLAKIFSWLQPESGGSVPATTKAAAAVFLFLETVVGMFTPPLISKVEGHSWWLSLLNCFSGGIFLTAGLMHLIPHCEEAQYSVNLADWHLPSHYPLYLLLICLGYLLVFCVERVMFEGHDHGHGHSHVGASCHDHHDHHHHHHDQAVHVSDIQAKDTMRKRKPAGSSPTPSSPEAQRQHEVNLEADSPAPAFSVVRGLPLLIGMSLHTALECLALGLIGRFTPFLILFTAIAAHKGVSALALSARFTKSGANLQQVLQLVGPFTLIAPTSIAIGHWAGNVLPPGLQLLLNCLAAGTFLYVGASEILAEEFEGHAEAPRGLTEAAARWIKFGAVMAAVICIAALGLMPHVHG